MGISLATTAATVAVIDALTKTQTNETDYFVKTIQSRLVDSPTANGSVYNKDANQLKHALEHAIWDQVDHPEVNKAIATSYRTFGLVGHMGMIALADLPGNVVVRFSDPKNTGFVSCDVAVETLGPIVGETWLIVGNDDGIVWTFHPGQPAPLAGVSTDQVKDGTFGTVELARFLGFTQAKRVYAPFENVGDIQQLPNGLPGETDAVAKQAHNTYADHCRTAGQDAKDWDQAEDWQRDSTRSLVARVRANPNYSALDAHRDWAAERYQQGWTWGETRDNAAKKNPLLPKSMDEADVQVNFNGLSSIERAKDDLLINCVRGMLREAGLVPA